MAFKNSLSTLTTVLICNLCFSGYETLIYDNVTHLSFDNNKQNIEIDMLTNIPRQRDIRNVNGKEMNSNVTIDKLINEKDIDYFMTTNPVIEKDLNDKDKMVANRSEIERFDFKDVTTEYYDNNTLEDCVGDPEYCNMTREEYFSMLNDYIFPKSYEWMLITTHAIVFVIGLIGNALVCIAVYRNHSMRTVTNYFIVNLAVADFMVILICLPPTVLWDVTETWFFGNAMCRLVLYFQVRLFFILLIWYLFKY